MAAQTRATSKLLGLLGALLVLPGLAAGEEPASQCRAARSAPAENALASPEVRAFLERRHREQAAAGAPADRETVVLNTGGYGYGPLPGVDFQQAPAEPERSGR